MRGERSLISASEVGEYVFCARAWRLHAEGREPAASLRSARDAGSEFHRAHGRGVFLARAFHSAAVVFTALSVLATLLLVLYLVLR